MLAMKNASSSPATWDKKYWLSVKKVSNVGATMSNGATSGDTIAEIMIRKLIIGIPLGSLGSDFTGVGVEVIGKSRGSRLVHC